MDIDSLSADRIGPISFFAIVLGGVNALSSIVGLYLTATIGRGWIPETTALEVTFGLLVTGLLLLTGIILVRSDVEGRAALSGWISTIFGTLFLLDAIGTLLVARSTIPIAVLLAGFTVSALGSLSLAVSGYYLRQLLDEEL